MRLVVCALLVACGGTPEPTQRVGAGVAPVATPAGADDVVVAQVNGRPIWGSCVAAQAKGRTAREGLDECVAFELLAQEAERRGLATSPDVVDETRTALVSRVVELEFEDRYQTPADLGAVLQQFVERNRAWLEIPETRSSAYVRYNLAQGAPPDQEAKARDLMEAFAVEMAAESGLTAGHLDTFAKRHFDPLGVKVEVATVPFFTKKGLALGYRDALFDIPEIGRTSPHAVRSQWGWDVVLLTDRNDAKSYTRERAAEEAFPEVRRGYFNQWVDQIGKANGVKVTRDEKAIEKLDVGEAAP